MRAATGRARSSQQPVEVPELRTELETVTANPDGSFTAEVAADPVRARGVDGPWREVDYTLTARDGAWTPVAGGEVKFSTGGGDQPLVQYRHGGAGFSLRWPKALPAPQISGPSATYVDALPGLDVVLTAEGGGYAFRTVTKSLQAPTDIDLKVDSDGYRIVADPDSEGVRIEDPDGQALVEQGPPQVIADSPAAGGTRRSSSPSLEVVADVVHLRLPGPTKTRSSADRPQIIDTGMGAKLATWSYVSSLHGDENYKAARDKQGLGSGRCRTTRVAKGKVRSCAGGLNFVSRILWAFRVDSGARNDRIARWKNRTVRDVKFRAFETHAFVCKPATRVDIRTVNSKRVSGATWNKEKKNLGHHLANRTVAYGHPDCKKEGSPVEFGSAALTSYVTKTLTAANPAAGILMKATKETDNMTTGRGWKRFHGYSAALSITFNIQPGLPNPLRMTDTSNDACPNGAGQAYLNTRGPTMRITNPVHKGEAAQQLTTTFQIEHLASDGTASEVERKDVGPKPNNTIVTFSPTAELPDGRYRWHATATDGLLWSGWGPWCEFTVDATAPSGEPSVTSAQFQEDQWGAPAGTVGEFQFTDAGNSDVAEYRWAFNNDQPMNRLPRTGEVTVLTVPVSAFGPSTLYVTMVDQAGNTSERTRGYRIKAKSRCVNPIDDKCAAAVFRMDEGKGTVAADASPAGRKMTLTVDPSKAWVAGPHPDRPNDRAVGFNGSTDHGHTGAGVDSTGGFSVAGWVRATDTRRDFTIVSQNGGTRSGLFLGARGGRWVFGHDLADAPNAETVAAAGGTVTDTWTHLAGVYNPTERTLRLYVNGEQVAEHTEVQISWNASADLQVGRERDKVRPLAGAVDSIRLFQGVLTGGDVERLTRADQAR
ncbi:LamG domain-containing protein [Pilimelia terevasa]|nr:LamG domain-containing protein [Pilimelia terevasa]